MRVETEELEKAMVYSYGNSNGLHGQSHGEYLFPFLNNSDYHLLSITLYHCFGVSKNLDTNGISGSFGRLIISLLLNMNDQ